MMKAIEIVFDTDKLKYVATVRGKVVGSYSTLEKALYKMYKYAKSQGM